jgi:hypothetical protein
MPFLTALSMLSFGTFSALAFSIAFLSPGEFVSPLHFLDSTVMNLTSFEKTFAL